MGDEWGQKPGEKSDNGGTEQPNSDQGPNANSGQPGFDQEEIDRRLAEIRRMVSQGASEAQQRIKRVVEKASDYWQQAQTTPTPREPSNLEEQRIRQLANMWSTENWRIAKDLGTYMDVVSWSTDEVWEVTIQTRWEIRAMEQINEPYTGKPTGKPQPFLPVWDYELPAVTGLKAPQSRTRLDGLDEIVACTVCNGTGRALCTNCNGRGWVVCPDCKGRTRKRCTTCRGRGYVADWAQPGEKKPFFKKQAENVANSVGERVADVFDGIRQQGVPIPNPIDTDPANKGKTVPCPDCINGEVDCSCGNGKRVCETCQGAKMSLCANCSGTGKLVRHREIVRRFDLRTQTRIVGESAIPQQQFEKASGELVYNAEVNETLHPEAAPDGVPMDVWRTTVDLVNAESQDKTDTYKPNAQEQARATLQVVELVRIPYTKVQYRFGSQDYVFYIYDGEGREKFYADRYPARWDRIERLVKAISNDLLTPTPENTTPPSSTSSHAGGYRVPIEVPPYNIIEEDEDNKGNNTNNRNN